MLQHGGLCLAACVCIGVPARAFCRRASPNQPAQMPRPAKAAAGTQAEDVTVEEAKDLICEMCRNFYTQARNF